MNARSIAGAVLVPYHAYNEYQCALMRNVWPELEASPRRVFRFKLLPACLPYMCADLMPLPSYELTSQSLARGRVAAVLAMLRAVCSRARVHGKAVPGTAQIPFQSLG